LDWKKILSADNTLPTAKAVDVMLLLEGTFPFVAGGVSSWVNQIIRGFPELTFGAVFIGSRKEDYSVMKFQLPDNFIHLECHYMHEFRPPPLVSAVKGNAQGFDVNRKFHQALVESRNSSSAASQEGCTAHFANAWS
jgi:polysaccharide biosynthesis protein PelF